MVERYSERQEVVIDCLRGIFINRQITASVFDLDGTLMDTHGWYVDLMREYCTSIAGGNKELAEKAYELMNAAIGGLRSTYHVNPTLMRESAKIVALSYGRNLESSKTQSNVLKLMTGLFDEPRVSVFDGVVNTLSMIQKAGLDNYLVTHANPITTRKKLEYGGLYYMFRGVYCVDDLGKKDVDAWRQGLKGFGLDPKMIIGAGDSWEADILPLRDIGVPIDQIFRVRTSYGYANRSRVEDVCEIDRFADLPGELLKL